MSAEWGIWVFLFGDMAVFTAYFACIAGLRAQQPAMFKASQQLLHPSLGVVNTVLLLTASLFVVRGVAAVREQSSGARYFRLAMACAMGFAVIKCVEYTMLVTEGHTLGSNSFFAYYYMFTAIHLTHLIAGAAVLLRIASITRRAGLTVHQKGFVECGACFWHLIDLLWLVLFPLLYFI
ncbi:cytochrome c oxidase subunit 3 [Mycolicibacterium neoaurum]|uniref:cytochrome c oxidase subunit 3 n=1 Tax=Mycolicibacterium neoaurum TaxID=1795 RepID=UPI002673AAA6|nr:cytochrome c oxidase subunit 3 [Mycolicibacterium neoaurum]MDO3398987.1 cytochrome c oxidase subunit 3 [Mycolicibacterium neoaurum]